MLKMGMQRFIFTVLLLSICLSTVANGFSMFNTQIPNGNIVPHPCPSEKDTWMGVGHRSPDGGGDQNHFGLDFKDEGEVWSKEFCELDSDGDGMTNGEELGDPNCVWTSGATTSFKIKSHPGVCEPVNSPLCYSINKALYGNKFLPCLH